MEAEPDRTPVLMGSALVASVFIPASLSVGLSPVLPQIRAAFSHVAGADFLTKALVTTYGVSALFGAPATGWLLERFRARLVLAVGCLVFILAAVAGAAMPTLSSMVATRFVAGLAAVIVTTSAVALIATRFPPGARARWQGYLGMSGAIFAMVAATVAGELAHSGWRDAFFVHLGAVPVLFLILLAFRDEAVPVRTVAVHGKVSAAEVLPTATMGLLYGTLVIGTSVYLPFRMHAAGVIDPKRIGELYGVYSLMSGAVSFSYGYMRRVCSIAVVNLIACAAMGGAYAMLGALADARWLVAELALLAVGSGLLTPNLYAFCGSQGDVAQKLRATGMGKAGFFAGPFVFQILMVLVGSPSAGATLLILAGLCLPTMAISLLNRRPTPALGEAVA